MRPSYSAIKHFSQKEKVYTFDIKHYDYTVVEKATIIISYFVNMDFMKDRKSTNFLSHWKTYDNVFLCEVKYNSIGGTFYAINSNEEYFLENVNRFNYGGDIDVNILQTFFDNFFKDVLSFDRKSKITNLLHE